LGELALKMKWMSSLNQPGSKLLKRGQRNRTESFRPRWHLMASDCWTKVQWSPFVSSDNFFWQRRSANRPRGIAQLVTNRKPLIAVVDDDESVCRALKRLLRSLGMSAEIYTSSSEFVELIEALPSFQPDCVVLDVQMPSMNGIEVQTRLRRARKEIPVIFLTAHDDRGARERALAGGAIAFLRKPCNDALLIRSLSAALESGEAGEKQGQPACGE
jgi:CheY-like chemotaxis protein